MTQDPEGKSGRGLAETMDAEDREERESYRPYLAGEVIGDRYKLETQIGRGGMGVVWVAHSLVLGIDVALKLIRADAAGSGVASRMAREAHAAARLGHPALVRVFDFGWTNRGDPFLVMELVQGDTLAEVIRRGPPLNAIRAVQTLLPIADGLRVAHERSIIHRDIKPDNIVLSADALGRRQPKLLDFGIAKVEQKAGSSAKITQMGTVLGSPEYMSPEQAFGLEDIDARTDVWSLSVVLYEMLTGDIPFSRPNYNALMQAIIHDDPDPTTKHGEGDGSLWNVLKKGLEKDRDDRWADMTEFGVALALWLYEHGIKEDISGNSIRAVWLDHGITQSNPAQAAHPGGSTTKPPTHTGTGAGARSQAPTTTPPSRRRDAAVTTGWGPSLRNEKKGRIVVAAGLAAVVALGAVLTGLADSPSDREVRDAIASPDVAQVEPNRALDEAYDPSPSARPTSADAVPNTTTRTGAGSKPSEEGEARTADEASAADSEEEANGKRVPQRRTNMGASSLPKAPIGANRPRPVPNKRMRHDFGF